MSISVIASLQGLTASPVSAVTVALVGVLAAKNVTLTQILIVMIPSTILGIAAGILSVWWKGKELEEDPEYLKRMEEGKVKAVEQSAPLEGQARARAIGSCIVFVIAILAVVAIGIFPDLRPVYQKVTEDVTETGQVEMGRAIMILMLCAAGVMMVLFKANPETAVKGSMWQAPANENLNTWTDENRIYQQLQYVSKIRNVSVLNRFRNEQRWRGEVVDDVLTGRNLFSNRIRYLLSFTIPVSKNPAFPQLVLSDEILMQFGKEIVYNTFDQNRFFVGIKKKLTPILSFDLGYMPVYQQKSSGYQYDLDHTLRWFFYFTPDFRKVKTETEPASNEE